MGLPGMIGKGYRTQPVIESIVKNRAVYFVAIGGAGALASTAIKEFEVYAYPELEPEVVYKLDVVDFPVIVAICLFILHPLGDISVALENISRVLKPDGSVISIDPVGHHHGDERTIDDWHTLSMKAQVLYQR